MSFGIRQLYKPRNVNFTQTSGDNSNYAEIDELLSTVKNFSTKSSHPNMLSQEEYKSLLKSSSINPETNPQIKDQIDQILASKQPEEPKNNPDDEVQIVGFSNSSTDRFISGQRSVKMDNELKKELDATS